VSLPTLPRWRTRKQEEPAGELPAVVVLVIVIVATLWLLAHGYSIDTSLETVAAAGVLSAGIASYLVRDEPGAIE
jgi:hypothetical protein